MKYAKKAAKCALYIYKSHLEARKDWYTVQNEEERENLLHLFDAAIHRWIVQPQ